MKRPIEVEYTKSTQYSLSSHSKSPTSVFKYSYLTNSIGLALCMGNDPYGRLPVPMSQSRLDPHTHGTCLTFSLPHVLPSHG